MDARRRREVRHDVRNSERRRQHTVLDGRFGVQSQLTLRGAKREGAGLTTDDLVDDGVGVREARLVLALRRS